MNVEAAVWPPSDGRWDGWSVGWMVSTRSANVQTTCIEQSSYGWRLKVERLRGKHTENSPHTASLRWYPVCVQTQHIYRSRQLGATKEGGGELPKAGSILPILPEPYGTEVTPDASHV